MKGELILSRIEGTNSKPRNQILETPESTDSFEKDEKLDQKDGDEGKRSVREWISDRLKQHKENKENKRRAEIDKSESQDESMEEKKQTPEISYEQKEQDLKQKLRDSSEEKKSTDTISESLRNYQRGTPEHQQALKDYNRSTEYDMTISDALGDGRKSGMLVESDIEEAKGLEQRYNEDILDIPPDGKKISKDQRKELEYVRTTNDRYIDLISDKRDNMSLALVAAEEGIQNKLDEIKHYRETSTDDKDTRERIEEKLNDEYEGMKSTVKAMKEKIKEADYHITKLKDNNREIDKIL